MRLALRPREPAWWIWLVTVALLAVGLAGATRGFTAAVALSWVQTLYVLRREGRIGAIGVQIRVSYGLLLMLCWFPQLRWLYWLPAVGTSALVLFGYCLLARTVSLFPWNRDEALSLDLLQRTFCTPPAAASVAVRSACGGVNGICEMEARVARVG